MFKIESGDLIANAPNEECSMTVNNVASLKSAIERRLVYVEILAQGRKHRTQLWPRSKYQDGQGGSQGLYYESHVVVSSDQVVDSATEAYPGKITVEFLIKDNGKTSGLFGYYIAKRKIGWNSESAVNIVDVALHCAPAGENGPRLAQLEFGYVAEPSWEPFNYLSNKDIIPSSGSLSCGLDINDIASLWEALFYGRIYVELEREDGAIWRGQLSRPRTYTKEDVEWIKKHRVSR